MAFTIEDDDLLKMIDHLSQISGMTKMDVIRAALNSEIERELNELSVTDKLAPTLAKASTLGRPSRMTAAEHKKASDEDWMED
jgi:hypothetical protein